MVQSKTTTYKNNRKLPFSTNKRRNSIATWTTVNQTALAAADKAQQGMTVTTRNTITITKDSHEALKKRAAESSKFKRDLDKATRTLENRAKDIDHFKETVKEQGEIMKTKDQEIEELKQRIAEMEKNAGAAAFISPASGKKKKVDKAALNLDLVEYSEDVAKNIMFRTCIFPEDEDELEEIAQEGIKYLPVALSGITEEKYVQDYKEIYYQGLKDARQGVQSELKKRAQGTKHLANKILFFA